MISVFKLYIDGIYFTFQLNNCLIFVTLRCIVFYTLCFPGLKSLNLSVKIEDRSKSDFHLQIIPEVWKLVTSSGLYLFTIVFHFL